MAKSQDSLSVVLPVFNDAANLTRRVLELLEFLPELTNRFEVVVIDNGSTDSTEETAHDLARQYPQMRVCRQPGRASSDQLTSVSVSETASDFVIAVAENSPISTVRLKRLWGFRELKQPEAAAVADTSSVVDRLKSWAVQLPATDVTDSKAAEMQMMRRPPVDEPTVHFREAQAPSPLWVSRDNTPSTAPTPLG